MNYFFTMLEELKCKFCKLRNADMITLQQCRSTHVCHAAALKSTYCTFPNYHRLFTKYIRLFRYISYCSRPSWSL